MQITQATLTYTAPVDAGRKNRRRGGNHGSQDRFQPGQTGESRGPRGPRQPQQSNRGNDRSRVESGRVAEVGASSIGGLQGGIAAAQRGQGITDLKVLADRAMSEKGMDPSYDVRAAEYVQNLTQLPFDPSIKDLRSLNWCSIDNGHGEEVTSKDLDQLSASRKEGVNTRVWVAIADVDSLMPKNSPPDLQAQKNTTTVYTDDKIYPMIDRHMSENLTSLNPGEDRCAMVTEMLINPDGEVLNYDIYPATVHSKVKLNYDSIGAWLENRGDAPRALDGMDEMKQAIRDQDQVAQALKAVRKRNGSLELESQEARAKMEDGSAVGMEKHDKNHATELIENLMVASNGCASKFLKEMGMPTVQRIVREPKNWDKIVTIAADKGYKLPKKPDSAALESFLEGERAKDPLRFPDLSLNVVKLLGRGEYVVEFPGDPPVGHFGLAVRDYSHSTAPNRRYPDVITQRLLKAAQELKAQGKTAASEEDWPYTRQELTDLSARCTEQEGNAQKVQRQIQKSAAALVLQNRIGERFDAIVSGANDKGQWVRLLEMPIEGKLQGKGARMGEKMVVQLVATNVEKGFIDFRKANGQDA